MNEKSAASLPHQIQMMMNGSIPPPPIANLIGFKLVSVSSGKAVIEFEAGDSHANPMGTLHGGVLCDISDAAMGMAYASRLNKGRASRHLNLKSTSSNQSGRPSYGPKASVVNGGKTVGLVMCDVFDERERLIARASCTCMTLRGKQAAADRIGKDQHISLSRAISGRGDRMKRKR